MNFEKIQTGSDTTDESRCLLKRTDVNLLMLMTTYL